MMAASMLAGWACAEITPPVGIHMGGYWRRTSGALEIHDPLMARALVFSDGNRMVGLLALDLVGLAASSVADIRAGVAAQTRVPAEALSVCCTHTHAGPLTLPFRGMGEIDQAYLQTVKTKAIEVVAEAADGLQPVELAYARPAVQIGINRRQDLDGQTVLGENPQGPASTYAHVLHVRRPEGEGAVLLIHACHAVVLGSANHSISADWPGAAVRKVEETTGQMALFVNGACGDINPRKTAGTHDEAERLGGEMAAAVVSGLGQAERLCGAGVAWSRRQLNLPLLDPPPLAKIAAEKLVLAAKSAAKSLLSCHGDYWAQLIPKARLQWAQDMLRLARTGVRGLSQPFEVHGLRVGHLALLGMEGEVFVRYQLDLEESSPLQPTLLCGYANGCVGYVPTADEYERGGYEVGSTYSIGFGSATEAYKVYPSVQRLAPESEAVVREGANEVLAELMRGMGDRPCRVTGR